MKMKILIVNTYDRGGAANACLRLHKRLLQQNIQSKVLLRNKTNQNIPKTYNISIQTIERSLKTKITTKTLNILKELKLYRPKPDNFTDSRHVGLEKFSYPNSIYDITKSDLYKNVDIINLHWVANFLDYPSFFIKNNKPVVWTLHDQNPFLGHEHYAETSCGVDINGYPIKRVVTKTEKQKFKEFIKIKKDSLSNFKNLHIVALCNWMADEVKQSEIFCNYPINIIPNGIDSYTFKPRDKTYSRELLNIPQNKKVILFVSDDVDKIRKGYIFLQYAFEQINRDDTVLMSIGPQNRNLFKKKNYIELGFVQEELLMSIIYSAADVFIIPSLMDNLPNTVLESIMCGTPVIGFPVGGIPDMIQDGVNGYLTKEISVAALLGTIEKFLETQEKFNSNKIRENAIEKYDLSVQANNYINLYQSILNKNNESLKNISNNNKLKGA